MAFFTGILHVISFLQPMSKSGYGESESEGEGMAEGVGQGQGLSRSCEFVLAPSTGFAAVEKAISGLQSLFMVFMRCLTTF